MAAPLGDDLRDAVRWWLDLLQNHHEAAFDRVIPIDPSPGRHNYDMIYTDASEDAIGAVPGHGAEEV